MSRVIVDPGSDTTFFLMQQISNLYNQAGLYGCKLSSDDATCMDNTAPYNATNDPDNPATTDYTDNYDRTEEVQGVDEVGSGAGQAQLCQNNQGSNTQHCLRGSRSITPALRRGSPANRMPHVSPQRRKTFSPLMQLPSLTGATSIPRPLTRRMALRTLRRIRR